MINIQEPEDLISISLYNILNYRLSDPSYINLIQNWNKCIQVEIKDFYPVIIEFKKGNIKFKRNIEKYQANLVLRLSLHTLLDLAYKRMSPIKAYITGKLKIRGVYKIFTLLKFSKIFLDTIVEIAADPNENYYEITRRGR